MDRPTAAPVTVRAAELVRPVEGIALGAPLGAETRTEIVQNLLPLAGTNPPSTVLAELAFVDPAVEGSVSRSRSAPAPVPPSRSAAPFDCLGDRERSPGSPCA